MYPDSFHGLLALQDIWGCQRGQPGRFTLAITDYRFDNHETPIVLVLSSGACVQTACNYAILGTFCLGMFGPEA